MMPRFTATECERAVGRLAAGHPPHVAAIALDVYPSTISHLWYQFQTTRTTRDAHA